LLFSNTGSEEADVEAKLSARDREMLGSNLSLDTRYRDWLFVVFLSPIRQILK
jgi:hypothetical protein